MSHYYQFKNVLSYFQNKKGVIEYSNLDDFIDKNRNLKSNGDFNNYELITFKKMQKTNEERRKLKESNYNTKFDKEFLEVKNSIYY